jgi:hypothetical protein
MYVVTRTHHDNKGGPVRRVGTWRSNVAAAALTALGALACAGATLAAGHLANGSYSGALAAPKSSITVKFKVTAAGRKVTNLTISNTPFYCEGGGRPLPVRFPGATISSAGTFSAQATNVIKEGPLKGQVGERLKITGKFGEHNVEQGKLTTTYPKSPRCTGSSGYTTKKS